MKWRSALPLRVAKVGCAVALSIAAIIVSPNPPSVRAADDGLAVTSSATYRLVPEEGRIRVTVELTATNTTADVTSGIFVTQTYFDRLRVAIQSESARIGATSGGRRLGVTISPEDDFDVVDVRLAEALYHRDVAKVRLTYDLPGGKPRSPSDIRVGVAYSTFVAWAFGDSGRVRIEVPAGHVVETAGSTVESRTTSSKTVLTSGPIADPSAWYAVVHARRDEELTDKRLELATAEAVVVRGWPEDDEWVGRVSDVLTKGLPVLDELVGLPWPVSDELEIVEIHAPLLEGYGGFYDVESDIITVSEDLDGQTILHEAAHAWFNGELFDDRWIGEGLADAYAARALRRVDGTDVEPRQVTPDEAAAFPLSTWLPPRPIRGDATASYEDYGYAASWFVVDQIVDRIGPDAMRAVLAAAASDEIAYLGDVPPERNPFRSDWGWFLDLIEERSGVEVDDLFRDWVAAASDATLLDGRQAARTAYENLTKDGDGWLPPYAVRGPLTRWRFDTAAAQIAAAQDVLEMRADIDVRAARLGLAVPPGLEAAYESASTDVAEAMTPAQERLDGLAELESAARAVAEPRDLIAELGLLDEVPPDDRLEEAKDAFEAGDFDAVAARSDALEATLAAAPDAGRTRLIGGGLAVAVGLLSVVAIVLVRRSRRRPRSGLVSATGSAAATLPPTSPGEVAGLHPADPASQRGDGPTDDGRSAPG
ncbi:MAG TPA: hypothetical protein VJZ72_02040 [Candidatus Limnocylindrales bacterium]|nr:hypothetical protein [Candidatus Limnocylindrales bacterium]